jgi:hypothetical protein
MCAREFAAQSSAHSSRVHGASDIADAGNLLALLAALVSPFATLRAAQRKSRLRGAGIVNLGHQTTFFATLLKRMRLATQQLAVGGPGHEFVA